MVPRGILRNKGDLYAGVNRFFVFFAEYTDKLSKLGELKLKNAENHQAGDKTEKDKLNLRNENTFAVFRFNDCFSERVFICSDH